MKKNKTLNFVNMNLKIRLPKIKWTFIKLSTMRFRIGIIFMMAIVFITLHIGKAPQVFSIIFDVNLIV